MFGKNTTARTYFRRRHESAAISCARPFLIQQWNPMGGKSGGAHSLLVSTSIFSCSRFSAINCWYKSLMKSSWVKCPPQCVDSVSELDHCTEKKKVKSWVKCAPHSREVLMGKRFSQLMLCNHQAFSSAGLLLEWESMKGESRNGILSNHLGFLHPTVTQCYILLGRYLYLSICIQTSKSP